MEEKKENKAQAEKPQTEKPQAEKKVKVSSELRLKTLEEENKLLNALVEKQKNEIEDYKDKWMRNVAEFDNYKKRNSKIWQDAFTEGKTEVIIKVLTVGDNLDMALTMNLDEKTMEGIKLIKKKFEETLKGLEVEEINPIGEAFDPNLAEALMQVDGEKGEEPNTVKQVFLKGYKLKDKIIRYAKVSVVKE